MESPLASIIAHRLEAEVKNRIFMLQRSIIGFGPAPEATILSLHQALQQLPKTSQDHQHVEAQRKDVVAAYRNNMTELSSLCKRRLF